MKKNVLLVVLSAASLVTGIWWLGFRYDNPQPTELSRDSNPSLSVEQPESLLDAELSQQGTLPPEAQSESTAGRIVHVPPGSSINTNPEPNYYNINAVTAEGLADFTNYNLEAALAGDLGAGYRVGRARERCIDVKLDSGEIEIRVQRAMRKYEQTRESGYPSYDSETDMVGNSYPTEAENRVNQIRWHEACVRQSEIFSEQLRQKLDRLAQQGHVVARYMYATWPPDYIGRTDAFLIQYEWAAKAREFSFLNLDQGEVAGLLAFGQSFSRFGSFTTFDRYLGYAFYKAAIDCGFLIGWQRVCIPVQGCRRFRWKPATHSV